jgi:branched-chain amino acid transport system ATP-binding protein
LDLLTGFSRPDAGRILFEASDLLGIPPHRLPPLGVMRTFQATRLIRGLTVRENIMLGAHHLTRARFLAHGFRIPMARAEEKGLQARAEQILAFLDLEDVADNVATELAAGLQRMVVLGSALASGPRLLLLDEPAAGLNDTETLDLAEVLRAVRTGGTTVVLIEHNVNLVMDVCDRVLVLDAGRVIADAGPPQVQEDPAVRAAYLGEGA